jgi:hypothetical protein
MPRITETQDRGGLAGHLAQLADGLGKLIAQHLQLARLELVDDAKAIGSALGRIALFVPMVIAGYLFVMGALAAALANVMSLPVALLAVGSSNLLVGGAGAYFAAQRLKKPQLLDESLSELKSSAATLASAAPSTLESEHAR